MFSRKLGFALGAVMIFLAGVAFILGRPPHRDARIYPLVRQYSPYIVENGLGGLTIKRKDDPKFEREPDAVNFYAQLQDLERRWAQKHLKIVGETLRIIDDKGKTLKEIPFKTPSEKRFVENYYGVKAP